MKRYDITEKFRIKRQGKDSDDFYWMFGKIHGLENLAYVDPEKILEAKGNPVSIQELANQVKPQDIKGHASYEELVAGKYQSL